MFLYIVYKTNTFFINQILVVKKKVETIRLC